MPAAMAVERTQGKTLVISHPQEPPNWNYWATGASALRVPVFMNVLQPLVEKLGDGSVAPLLAESWTISDDGLVYTFKLREAKFHDGTTFEAADVVYSLEKNKKSPLGPTAVPLAPVEKMEAVDDRTVRLTLSKPSQRLLSELGLGSGIIVPEGAHEKYDLAKEEIGTGPYTFGDYRPDVHVVLTRFEDYWGDKPFFEKVTFRFIPDETSAANALLAGEVDSLSAVFGEGLDRIKSIAAGGEIKIILPSPLETSYFFLSTRSKPLRDIRVRQAIAHAIDRDAHLLAAQSGYGETTCTMVIPFSEPWNTGYCPYPYDVARAKALLAEAGYKDGLKLDFPFLTVAEHPVIKDVAVAQLADAGITLETRPLDLATWLDRVNNNGEYEFSNLTSSAKAEAYVCRGGRQPLGKDNSEVCDETFDKLVAESDAVVDRGEYVKKMTEMVNTFADSAWVIPIFSKSTPTLARADLEGIKGFRYLLEYDLRNLRWAGK